MLRLYFCCFVSYQYLVSVPLRMFRLWAFMGMMAQVRQAQNSITNPCCSVESLI